ncbi:MAG: TVP38/TMEM64 family protein [Leptolyngbya sp.]|nr:MAG: TVP38/TMEM64 family protein [Leptolyngbya sp.]
MQIRQSQKRWIWAAFGTAIPLAMYFFSQVLVLYNEAVLVDMVRQQGQYAPVFFVLLFAIATSLGFPGNVISMVGGAVFGLAWGTVWSLLGATFGAMGAFLIARSLLHNWFTRQFGHLTLLQHLNRAIADHPFTLVVASRFTPLSPFSLLNFLFGLTPIDLKTYAWGTFLGLIPLTFAYSWFGITGYSALHGGDRLPVVFALSLLTLLTLLPMLTKKSGSRE